MSGTNGAGTPPRSKAAHVVGVTGDASPQTLTPKHVADLAGSAITPEQALAAGAYSEGSAKAIGEIVGWPWRNGGGGLVFPFFDYDSGAVTLARVKPDKPRTSTKSNGKVKPVKYEQPSGSGAHPYFGPHTRKERRLDDASRPLVWAEGEKKTLALDALGYPVIGISGCHNWSDSKANQSGDGIVWAREIKKYADRFFAKRAHVICLDSDCLSNPDVFLAMRRLAGILLETGATSVRYVMIPAEDPAAGVGIDDYLAEHGEEKTRAVIAAALPIATGEDVEPIAPKDPLVRLSSLAWLRGAKLDKDLRLPPGFEIRRDGSVWSEPPADKPDGLQTEVMKGAVIPIGLLESENGEEQRVLIAYFARGQWRRAMVDKHDVKNTRRALENMPPGTAIDSNNAARVVAWFTAYMHTNARRMKVQRFVSKLGWQTVDDQPCFILNEPITRGSMESQIVADTTGDHASAIEALLPIGSLDAHIIAMRRFVRTDDVSAIMYLSALAATLLKPLGAPNFAVHLYGESTTGKTTRLKCAAGIYGDPKNGTWVGSWNATPTAMEARAALLNDLPLCFDEIGAGDARAIEKAIYMLVNGEGKSRSNRSLSAAATLSWRDVILTTGEHEITSSISNTGAQVRVVQIRSRRFVDMDRAQIDDMRDACDAHHGQLGRDWIQGLVNIKDWGAMRQNFRDAKAMFDSTSTDPLTQRQSAYFAVLAVAEHMSHEWFGIGEETGGTVRRFVASLDQRSRVVDASERAIELLSTWTYSQPLSFPRIVIDTSNAKVTHVAAPTTRVCGAIDDEHVLFLPALLRRKLEEAGVSYAEITADWLSKGWIDADPDRVDAKVKLNGSRTRFVRVKRSVLGRDAEEDFAS